MDKKEVEEEVQLVGHRAISFRLLFGVSTT